MAAARARVNDSHKLQIAKLQEVSGHTIEMEPNAEEMSDISVSGDTTHNHYQAQPTGMGWLVLATVLAGAAGAGLTWWQVQGKSESPSQPKPLPAWQLGLEVRDEP